MLGNKVFTCLACMVLALGVWGCDGSGSGLSSTSVSTLAEYIERGDTAEGKPDRVLVVDTRSSVEYIDGHIKDALNVPYDMVARNGMPLYTNGWDTISTDASNQLADSWFAHMLINQLVNDFVSTYADSRIIFYGKASRNAVVVAEAIGYENISYLSGDYERWAEMYPDLTRQYGQGVVSVDKDGKSFVFSGSINAVNYDNVSTRGTHHGITYYGGALSPSSFLLANIPPFIFHEILVYLGVSPKGNMAKGIYYGDMDEWGVKFPNGQRIDFSVTWEGADRFYSLSELYEEKPSEFDPAPEAFVPVGMFPRMGGTRDANLLWNPGCIYCQYACVCGITSNARANEITWFDDGGIYDVMNFPNDERNYYAGRYYPKAEIMPGPGGAIRIKATVVADDVEVMPKSILAAYVRNGNTAEEAYNRVLVVDTRSSEKYIQGHIRDALNVPGYMIQENGRPLYTNGWDEVSVTASDQIADSWLAHMLINQLVNDFVSTYQDSEIVFYGDDAYTVAKAAQQIGYSNVFVLNAVYEEWAGVYARLTETNAPGVVSVDKEEKSFVFSGFINKANYVNVSTRPTHHGITYKGGALSFYSFLVADIPPFCFHEMLVFLGISPEGNMADGIYYGTPDEYADKYPDGDRVDYAVTWEGADRYYGFGELFEERPSEFHPDPGNFTMVGIEPRMGGTRDSNLLWNPGCIYCQYSCVCGITSNARANEITWFDDGGIYDPFGQPDNPRNYYAGRYFPRLDLFPGQGEPVRIRATIVR